jgi:hypothetical protein
MSEAERAGPTPGTAVSIEEGDVPPSSDGDDASQGVFRWED